jgi:hypothetical protein
MRVYKRGFTTGLFVRAGLLSLTTASSAGTRIIPFRDDKTDTLSPSDEQTDGVMGAFTEIRNHFRQPIYT